jgi:GAF domain-containing protein
MDTESLIDTARRLSQRLQPADLDATLSQITAAAVELLPNVQYCSITVLRPDGTLSTAAPTDEMLLRLDAEQYRLHEGPCYEAATHADHVVSADLRADERFPRYGEAAVAEGIRSQIGIRLFETPKSNGALNLYSTRVGAFEDSRALSGLFAHQAGQAIAYAYQIGNLGEAVRSRTVIGEAVGIVMERYGLSDERAFAFLQRLSSQRNLKVRLVAQQIVEASGRERVEP